LNEFHAGDIVRVRDSGMLIKEIRGQKARIIGRYEIHSTAYDVRMLEGTCFGRKFVLLEDLLEPVEFKVIFS